MFLGIPFRQNLFISNVHLDSSRFFSIESCKCERSKMDDVATAIVPLLMSHIKAHVIPLNMTTHIVINVATNILLNTKKLTDFIQRLRNV